MVMNVAKQFIDYIYDELVSAPAIDCRVAKSVIPKDLAIKYLTMYQDEVISDLVERGIKPLDIHELEERVYALYNGGVAYVGKGTAGNIFLEEIVPKNIAKNAIAFLHTHPIPLPIPTPEDLASAANLGYRVECVASRDGENLEVVCVSPRRTWHDAIDACYKLTQSVLSVNNFLVVRNESEVIFVPLPSPEERARIIERFSEVMSAVANVEIVES